HGPFGPESAGGRRFEPRVAQRFETFECWPTRGLCAFWKMRCLHRLLCDCSPCAGSRACVPESLRMFRDPCSCSGMATCANLMRVGCARIMDPTTVEMRNPVFAQERPVEREKRTLFQAQRRNPEPGSMDTPIEE